MDDKRGYYKVKPQPNETPLPTKIVIVAVLAMILTIVFMTLGFIIVLLIKGILFFI